MRTYTIDGFTYEMRSRLVPRLSGAIAEAGGRLVGRRTSSADRVELLVELHPRSGLELYFALAAQGVELSRGAQQTLIAFCDPRANPGRCARALGETLSVRLIVRVMEDAPLPMLLTRSSLIV